MTEADRAPSLPLSLVVELAGPAGAGKSSVFARLLDRVQNVEVPPVLRTRPYARVLATNVPAVVATLVRRGAIRGLTVEKGRSMLYLRALPSLIERRPVFEANVLVFDQGPLYLLSEAQLREQRLAAWRRKTLATWAPILDVIVWLDAPDDVLAARIDTRSKWHRLKGRGLDAAADILGEAREAYEGMLSTLEAREDGPSILRFDTSQMSPDDVVDALLQRVDGFAVGTAKVNRTEHAPPAPLTP